MKDENKYDKLIVSEVFYSIQGEGQTMGKPAVFLRLAGCNLLCTSHEWVCDTIPVWTKGRVTEFEKVLSIPDLESLRKGAHLIITGGEPLMQKQALYNYLRWLRVACGFRVLTEIETNGTVMPQQELFEWIHWWNVSPKLKNSGMVHSRRVKEAVLQTIQMNVAKDRLIFKFVVTKPEDMLEIADDYLSVIYEQLIVLMPGGETNEQLSITRPIAAELAKKHGLRYSDRLQVAIWNKATGV